MYPNRSIIENIPFSTVERKFEFHISNDQIREISREFYSETIYHPISDRNANQIVETYVMPLIESSDMHSLFLEILNPF